MRCILYQQIIAITCYSLLVAFQVANGETVYITPTDNSLCPDKATKCITFTKYAITQRQTSPTTNTTLILLPGNHSLSVNLTIENVNTLAIISDESQDSKTTTQIMCVNSAKFQFNNISKLHMRSLQLFGCTDNHFTMVNNLLFENCRVYGQEKNGTGLRLNHVGWALIRDSTFTSLTGTSIITPKGKTFKNGGAMIVNHTNIFIETCTFDGNSGYDGGALYAIFSNVTITSNSSYTNNKAHHNGGGVYTWNSTLNIDNTTGRNNVAIGGGGLVYVTSQTDITMECCVITHNAAGNGGGVRLQGSSVGSFVNCTFTNNGAVYDILDYRYGGALCITGSRATVLDTVFLNNNSSDYGGGLYVYDGQVTLYQCLVCQNEAERGGGMYASLANLDIRKVSFCENIAGYDGGALWMANSLADIDGSEFTSNTARVASAIRSIRGSTNNNINVTDTAFTYNVANFSTLYISQNTFNISGNTTFSYNKGSMFIYSSAMSVNGHTILSHNSYLTEDGSVQEGGALTTYQSNISFIGHTEFVSNQADYGGAIFATESVLINFGQLIINGNTAMTSGGGIYGYQTGLNFKSSSVVIQNNDARELGGGIYASSSIVRLFGGSLKFYRNTAEMGGGVSLVLSGKLYIIKERPECNAEFCNRNRSTWIRLEFIENTASYGGGVYIEDVSNCASTPFQVKSTADKECFFQALSLYSFYDRPTMNYRNTKFIGNKATKDGQTIYGGLLDRCSVSPFAEVFENYYAVEDISANSFTYLKNVTNIQDENIYHEISSMSVRVCFCRNGEPDCSYQPPKMYVKRGQMFRVPVVTVNQVNNSMVGTIQSILLSGDGGFSEGQYSQQIQDPNKCTYLNYSIVSPNPNEVLSLYAEGPCKDIGISNRTLEVEFLPCDYCPIGFKVPPSSCDCKCDPALNRYISNCSIESQTVRRRDDAWISYINESDLEGYITYENCPYDYCLSASSEVNVDLSKADGSDAICTYNRSKLLCGSCRDGLSVTLGTSNCKRCSNYWLALLFVFAVAGIVLVAFLIICNLTVAVGTINGLIFYANIIAANRPTFLPFQTPNIFTVFIAWLNLDFGFETCFYDGLDGYVKTWLQLAFPTYIIFLVVMVIILSDKFQKFGALLRDKDPAATLATLVLLSYSKLLRTIIAVFSFANISYPDGSSHLVWLIDANIRYLETKHIPLFLLTVLILILGLFYTLFLASWQCLLKSSDHRGMKWLSNVKLYSFINPYFAPFSNKHRYWTGLLLLVRALLYTVTAVVNIHGDPSINLLTIIALACFVLLLKERYKVKVYTKWPVDALESSYIFNLIIFSAATLYVRATSGNQTALAYTSTAIAFVTFLGILLYHMYMHTIPDNWREKLKCRCNSIKYIFKKEAEQNHSSPEEQPAMRPCTNYSELREPLLNDDSQDIIQTPETSRAAAPQQTTYSEISAIPTVKEWLNAKANST